MNNKNSETNKQITENRNNINSQKKSIQIEPQIDINTSSDDEVKFQTQVDVE